MEFLHVAGQLLRAKRLERNWSQETLCHGICAVSYLSKIEQGKVEANQQIVSELFSRLNIQWNDSPEAKILRDNLLEATFSFDHKECERILQILEADWEMIVIGPYYADFAVLRAFYNHDPNMIHKDLEPLLDNRQRALLAILCNHDQEAYQIYPCALTAVCAGEQAFLTGNYTQALEFYQIACDQAAQQGFVHLLMFSHHAMAACFSNLQNMDAMNRHSKIAERIAKAVGNQEILYAIQYNEAATKIESGDFLSGYNFFSALDSPSVLDLHKLAVCCEGLGKVQEGIAALDLAENAPSTNSLDLEMCRLVRYRLENPDYLLDPVYGQLLMTTFHRIKEERSHGFARFHLRWVTEWLCSNRQYRKAFEILQDFTCL